MQDLIDALEMQGDRAASYLNCDTGEVHVISHDALAIAADGTDADAVLGDCEEEEVELAQRVLDSDRYLELPTSWDVHEWHIMEAFCYSLAAEDIRADCLSAIGGRGAFRYFKDQLARHGLRDSWYAFRAEALRKIAIEWCQEHEIVFEA